MKNPFKKEVTTYKASEALTPYQRAQQEWDLRIGSARSQAKNWRILAAMSMLTTIFLAVILIIVAASRKDHVYIAEVTKEGRIVNVAPIIVRYKPSEAQKEFFIARFIDLIRSIPMDPVLAKKNWLDAYNFLGVRGSEILNQLFRKESPTKLLGKKTVAVQITDINPVTPTTMHVNWDETVVKSNGQVENKNSYSGVFTIIIKQPTKHKEFLSNPLGIYITDFNITPKETSKTKK